MYPKRIRRGDIFIANLDPVEGSEQGGTRPILTIQNNTGNRFSDTVIVAIITSKHKGNLPTHVELGPRFGLTDDSVLAAEQIRSIAKSRLMSYVGHVDRITMYKVNRALKISMGLLRNEPYIATLCQSCASAFYHSSFHVIRRADRYQTAMTRCGFCHAKPGLDYYLNNRERRKPVKGGQVNENTRLPTR